MLTLIRNFFLHLLINASIFLHSEHEYINSCNLSVRRYYHFIQEQIFVKNITNICDRLRFDSYPYSKQFVQLHTLNSIDKIHISVLKIRFKDRPVRKLFLRRDLQLLTIPPLTYTPLGNSTDSVQVIRRCIHSEGIAFNTKGTQRVYTVSGSFHSTTSTITTFETYIDEVRLPFCNISNELFHSERNSTSTTTTCTTLPLLLPPPLPPLSLTFSTLYAHTTAARCPALILFELEEHPIQTDLATFLEAELDKYSEEDVGKHKTLLLIPYFFLQTSLHTYIHTFFRSSL